MSVILCSSYKRHYLNNFFILLNKEFSLFNNALIKYLFYSFVLCKIRVFFLYLFIIRKHVNFLCFFSFFVFLLYLLQRMHKSSYNSVAFYLCSCGFFSYLCLFFFSIFLSFFNIFLFFLNFSYIYKYILFFFFFYKNYGFGLPCKRHYEIILKSPHGHKKSKERFLKKIYRRGLQYPCFYATDTNIWLNRLFNQKKGILLMHRFYININ
jgi:hypothetical protein